MMVGQVCLKQTGLLTAGLAPLHRLHFIFHLSLGSPWQTCPCDSAPALLWVRQCSRTRTHFKIKLLCLLQEKRKSAKLKDSRKQLCYQLENIIVLLNSCIWKASSVKHSPKHHPISIPQHFWWDGNEKLVSFYFAGPGLGTKHANIR